jgi:hypothetical protein
MFDPALEAYWGTRNFDQALETCLRVIGENAAKVDGIKISLLDKDKEIRMRRLLPAGVKMYTGDDFNYPELIAGDSRGSDYCVGLASLCPDVHLANFRVRLEPSSAAG